MFFRFLFPLFLLLGSIFATSTEGNLSAELASTTKYDDLPLEMKEKIYENFIYKQSIMKAGLVNKENFEILQQKVKWFKLSLPFPPDINKPPSDFLCQQLKSRKFLRLVVYEDYFIDHENNDLAYSFFKCLTNVENLNIIGNGQISFGPSQEQHYFPKSYFPRLKVLEMNANNLVSLKAFPNGLNSLKITFYGQKEPSDDFVLELKEKIKEMNHLKTLSLIGKDYKHVLDAIIPILNEKETFKKLSLEYKSSALAGEQPRLFKKPELINFAVDLILEFTDYVLFVGRSANFIQQFPKTIENLDIKANSLRGANVFCNEFSKFDKLKSLKLTFEYSYEHFECIFGRLPDTLEYLYLQGDFKLYGLQDLQLSSSLKIVELARLFIDTKVFIKFAEKVEFLNVYGDIIDPENLLLYRDQFKHLKKLHYDQSSVTQYTASSQFLTHLYDLMPNRMVELRLDIIMNENEMGPILFEQKILNGKKIFTDRIFLDIKVKNSDLIYYKSFYPKGDKMGTL